MKKRGIALEYREWERTGKAYVYGTEGVGLSSIEMTIDTVKELVSEFNLPLKILNGNTTNGEDTRMVESLITENTEGALIVCERILDELLRYWNEGVLHYGLIALVNPKTYRFKNRPADPEPSEHGWSDPQGLSVLRRFDIKNAVRHEFGHMVGLATMEHHPGCAMDWSCSVHEFCENCRRDINEIWEITN